MFTSRAEYRLLLREDNADLRLTEIGYDIGLASDSLCHGVSNKRQAVGDLISYLGQTLRVPDIETNSMLESFASASLRNQATLAQILRRPEISLAQIRMLHPDVPRYSQDVDAQAEIQLKYEGYVTRQLDIVERFKKMENAQLPVHIDYSKISGLSREVCEKLSRVRPQSIGQASRIPGITPAAISLLSFYVKKRSASHA